MQQQQQQQQQQHQGMLSDSFSSPSHAMPSYQDASPSTETHRAYHVLPGGGVGGLFTFRLEPGDNGSFVVSFVHDPRRSVHQQDDVGALYYVIAVILIYGCSILMMIASYIRKNKVDRRLNRYLKEMANVRKRERRMTLMASSSTAAAAAAAAKTRAQSPPGQAGQRSVAAGERKRERTRSLLVRSLSPSTNLPPPGQETPAVVPTTSNGSPTTEPSSLPATGFPFLGGVDRRRRWPGLLLLRPTVDRQQQPQPPPSSPVLIVCENDDDRRSDYDDSEEEEEDSEANNSYRSERYGPRAPSSHRHPVKGACGPGRKAVKLCVPAVGGRGVAEPTSSSAGRCSGQGSGATADEVVGGSFGRRDSPDYSSDCRSDEDCSPKTGWNDIPAVSNV